MLTFAYYSKLKIGFCFVGGALWMNMQTLKQAERWCRNKLRMHILYWRFNPKNNLKYYLEGIFVIESPIKSKQK